MKHILSLLVLFCIAMIGAAQSKEVNIKNGATFDPKGTINEFIGQKEDVILYNSWKKGPWVGGVKAGTLAQAYEVEVEMPEYNGKEVTYQGIYLLQDELVLFATHYDKKEDKRYLFAQKLSDKGKREGNLIKLDEIDAETKRNSGNFSFEVNSATGRIIIFSNPPYEKYSKEKFAFKILDKNLDLVWEKDIELPYADRYFTTSDFILDENDVLYMACTFNDFAETKKEEGRKKAKEEAKERGGNWFSYKIVSYNNTLGKVKEFDITLEKGQAIVSFNYNLDAKGDINVAGLYANGNDKAGGANGVYFIKIDHNTAKINTSSIQEFEKAMVEEYLIAALGEKRGTKQADKGEGIDSFVVREFINKDDGGLLISGETYRVYTVCTTDSKGVTRCTTHYIYGFIIVIDVSPKGDILWTSHVPKYQHTVNDGGFFSSYELIVKGDNLYYIFNDNVKNYDPKKKASTVYPMTSSKKAVTTIARMDAEGKVKKEADAKLRTEKKMLRPKVSAYIAADDKTIMLAKWGKKESVVEIKVD
jgi:hypothetical protein